MSQYITSAANEAEQYKTERKRAAEAAIRQQNAVYDEKQAASDQQVETATRAAETKLLDTVDTAAVEEALALAEAREALARAGLATSGYAKTRTVGIQQAAARAGDAARRDKKAAEAKAVAEGDSRTRDIAQAREQYAREQNAKADEDAAQFRQKLMSSAYAAEAKETAAATAAQQKREAAAAKAREKAQKEAANRASQRAKAAEQEKQQAESRRREAIRLMYNSGVISPTMYAMGLEYGWSSNDLQEVYLVTRQAQRYVKDGNPKGAVQYVQMSRLTPEQMTAALRDAGVDDYYIEQYGR